MASISSTKDRSLTTDTGPEGPESAFCLLIPALRGLSQKTGIQSKAAYLRIRTDAKYRIWSGEATPGVRRPVFIRVRTAYSIAAT